MSWIFAAIITVWAITVPFRWMPILAEEFKERRFGFRFWMAVFWNGVSYYVLATGSFLNAMTYDLPVWVFAPLAMLNAIYLIAPFIFQALKQKSKTAS